MEKYKRSLVNKFIVVGLVIWLILGTGLAAAGTLTLTLEPSLDGKGDIRATSITQALLSTYYEGMTICTYNATYNNYSNCTPYKAATITNGTAQFNLSDRDAGNRYIMINNLSGDLIPTRIDDPTKDIHQFVGKKLRVSIIGNFSDPTYQIETFVAGRELVSYSDGTHYGENIYTILSLKTNPQRFQVVKFSTRSPIVEQEWETINYTPAAPTHPSTSTSTNPSFSKWMFGKGSHGNDYGGNDSKCSICHGNLDAKPAQLSEITVNNGFCFRCHYGKGGTDAGFTVETITQLHALTSTPPPPATPKAPGFEALSVIAALMVVLLIKRK